MKLTITGIHMDTGEALREHTAKKLQTLKRHFDHLIDVDIAYSKRHLHHADIDLRANGTHLKAEGEGLDAFVALNDAVKKLALQLEKHKGHLQKHRHMRDKVEENLTALTEHAA
ncbi:MAG: ribosome-associated translation inhibitor RaiA [Alphaproteobacteria bacterium]